MLTTSSSSQPLRKEIFRRVLYNSNDGNNGNIEIVFMPQNWMK